MGAPEPLREPLRERELQILRLLADGMSDRAIAARLALAPETVRWYNKQLYLKLGVANRTQAVRRGTALGVLDVPLAPAAPAHPHPAPARPVPRSPIRYVDNGGVYLAWQTVGAGPVDLLFIAGFVSHLEVAWESPEYAAFFEALGRSARVILFDKRGVGLSDRVRGAPTLEETVGDARAVLDAARSPRAFVMGTSEGGAAAILLALRHPERVQGLVLCGATARVARAAPGDAEPAWSRPREEFDRRIAALLGSWGAAWAVEQFAPSRLHDEAFVGWWSRMLRAASSPSAVRAVLEVARDVDVRELLPQVAARTLVVHRTGDRIVAVEAGRYLAARMPDARLVELPGDDHVWFVRGDDVARAVARFLAEPDEGAGASPESRLAVILHSTGPGSLLTDEKRAALDAGRAQHPRATPHGWTALFDGPSRALACARRLRDLGRGRTGAMALHVGACRVRDGLPLGVAHEAVQQLAALAAPGEIVISGTLRDILAGSGLALEPFTRPGADGAEVAFGWRLLA